MNAVQLNRIATESEKTKKNKQIIAILNEVRIGMKTRLDFDIEDDKIILDAFEKCYCRLEADLENFMHDDKLIEYYEEWEDANDKAMKRYKEDRTCELQKIIFKRSYAAMKTIDYFYYIFDSVESDAFVCINEYIEKFVRLSKIINFIITMI